MLALALDTCGTACSAALIADGKVLAARFEVIGRGHAERLPGMLDAAMREAGARFAELETIVCTVGPGSFTGVRIGLAAARGLALANRLPVLALTSLEALAASHLTDGETLTVLAESGADGVFGQNVSLAGDAGEPWLRSRDAPCSLAPGIRLLRPASLAGWAEEEAEDEAGEKAGCAIETDGLIRAHEFAVFLRRQPGPAGPGRPAPIYLRPPPARPRAG